MMIESKKFTNPFPGLRPFETDEYRLFFGREGQSDALITRLQRARFLAVVGTSGSGKSSLVRAGLLPALRGGMMAGAGSGWRICIMRPGSDPFGNLAHSLAEKDVLLEAGGGLPPAEAEAVIEATLRRGSLGLVDVAQHGQLADEKLLVVVDQFEELFRFRAARAATSTDDDASAFVKLLLEAAQQRKFSLYVVLTMRSDFLGDCAQFQGLPEAINDGQYLIPRMTRDERRMAVTGPVGVTRGKMAEPLVNTLLNDVGDNPDQLPILQHALMRTWDYWATHRRNGEPIGLEHYETIGTMAEALSLHADEAWGELPNERSRRVGERLFKALTEKGADNREIRRPTRLSEISAAAEATEDEVVAVIEVFRREGRSFLMPPAEVALSSDTVIDISHESLIRNWDRLQKWVDEEAQSARIYRRLAEAAVLHREGKEGLLIDPALQIALEWREQHRPNRAWANRYHSEFDLAIGFLDASREHRDAQLAAERAREQRELERARDFAEKQARAARGMRRLTAGMAVMFLISLATAAFAWNARRQAIDLRDDAVKQRTYIASLLESEKAERQRASNAEKKAEDQFRIAKVERDKAVKASKAALDAQGRAETEAARANLQALIAARNQLAADKAKKIAEENAEQFRLAEERSSLTRVGLEAFRREEFDAALKSFDCLRERLESLQLATTSSSGPGSKPCSQDQTPGPAKKLAVDLGWTLSNIGATYQKQMAFPEAVASYERAIAVFEQALPKDSNDRILLDTYEGLARSYYALARNSRPRAGTVVPDKNKSQQEFKKAEDFFKLALAFQEKHRRLEAAGGHLDLARLYVDTGKFSEAEERFKSAVKLRWLEKKSADLESNERAALVAALRELAEFHQGQGRFDDAIREFNEMIVVQEDITVSELVDQGQEIANSYADLARIHAALADAAKADAVRADVAMTEAATAEAARAEKAKADAEKADAAMIDRASRAKAAAETNLAALAAEKAEANKKAAFHTAKVANAMRAANVLQRTALKLRQIGKSQDLVERSALVKELTGELDELADAYSQLGKFPDAEAIHMEALEYRGEINEQWKSYAKLAKFYREDKKDSAKADEYENLLKQAVKDNADALLQLGNDPPSEDAKKPSEAEKYYKDALVIYRRQSDWNGENKTLFGLSKLYLKQKRIPERQQAQRDRVDTMATYFKQLAMKADPLPKDPVNLVYQYLYAINDLAYGNKDNIEADATYRKALDAFDYILGNVDDKKVLDFYAATLEDYQKLLTKLGKEAEAARVAEAATSVRKKQLTTPP